MRYVLAYSR